jgi:hypothetical protein
LFFILGQLKHNRRRVKRERRMEEEEEGEK